MSGYCGYSNDLYDVGFSEASEKGPSTFNDAEKREEEVPGVKVLSKDDIMTIAALDEGNDGKVYRVQLRKGSAAIGKWAKRGMSQFWLDLMAKGPNKDLLSGGIPFAQVKIDGELVLLYKFHEVEDVREDVPLSDEALVESLLKQVRALHELGFNHMDIAPRNVLLTENGLVLIDFNLVVRHQSFPVLPVPRDVSSPRVLDHRPVRASDDFYGVKITLEKLGIPVSIIEAALGSKVMGDVHRLEAMAQRHAKQREEKMMEKKQLKKASAPPQAAVSTTVSSRDAISMGVYHIRSPHGTYLRAHPGGEGARVDLQTAPGGWELWTLVKTKDGRIGIRSCHGTYLRAHPGGEGAQLDLQVDKHNWDAMGWEQFTIVPTDRGTYGIRSPHGTYIRCWPGGEGSKVDLQVDKHNWDQMGWEQFDLIKV